MNSLKPLSLRFVDTRIEDAYADHLLPRLRLQGRAAIVVGILVYLSYGALDPLFVAPEYIAMLWSVRGAAMVLALAVLALTFTSAFAHFNRFPLLLVALGGSIGVLAIAWFLPFGNSRFYFPGLLLAIVFTYNLIGARFIHAFWANVLVLLLYNLLFAYLRPVPEAVLLSQNFFIVAANLIGGAAGYLAEMQQRQLFLHERELDDERRHHLNRSLHDRLTGLPNRELLEDRMNQSLAMARRDGARHAGFFLDLDGFKQINDRLGHEAGDRVLCELASRLTAVTRETDTVCRLGGDEFFLLVQDVGSCDTAVHFAEKLMGAIDEPFTWLPDDCPLSASIGVCMFPRADRANTPEAIIRHADQAMYEAKAAGKRCYRFAT